MKKCNGKDYVGLKVQNKEHASVILETKPRIKRKQIRINLNILASIIKKQIV